MNKPLYEKTVFSLLAERNPKLTFRTGFEEIDDLLGGSLQLGEIFEICSLRYTAKVYLAHSILANALISYRDDEEFRIIVFNCANQFNTDLLVKLLKDESKLTDDKIDDLLKNNVVVKNVINWKKLHSSLHNLMESVSEDRVWSSFEMGSKPFNAMILITDIGSLLHDSSYMSNKGHVIQDRVFKCLDHLSRGGAFILLLNHCVFKNGQTSLLPALGLNWRRLVKQRMFLTRNDEEFDQHTALIKEADSETINSVKFRLHDRQRVIQTLSEGS